MNGIRGKLLIALCGFLVILSIVFTVIVYRSNGEPVNPTTLPDHVLDDTSYPDRSAIQTEYTPEIPTAPGGVTGQTVVTVVTITQGTTAATTAAPAQSNYAYAYAGLNPVPASIDSANWNLLLVNRDYILPENFDVKLATVSDSSVQLDYRVVPYYNDMLAAAKADGVTVSSVSGYRSYSRQKTNFENKINYYVGLGYSKIEATNLAAKVILPPGTSEHNAGLAMDVGTNGDNSLTESFADTAAFKWLNEHAAEYGFILRYDKPTQDITKITYEPWHWRFVGVQTAQSVKASGLTLEEWLERAQ